MQLRIKCNKEQDYCILQLAVRLLHCLDYSLALISCHLYFLKLVNGTLKFSSVFFLLIPCEGFQQTSFEWQFPWNTDHLYKKSEDWKEK